MEEMTGKELQSMFAIVGGLSLGIVFTLAFIFRHFVALRAKPTSRAVWTSAPAYIVAVLVLSFGLGDAMKGLEIYVPLAALPAFVLVFLYWRFWFRREWIEHPELLPEGQTIANDDWRTGLWLLALPVLAALPKAIMIALID